MQVTISNDLAEMSLLRDSMLQFSEENQLSQEAVFALDLCLEELITNIIKYGYEDSAKHSIHMSLFMEGDLLVLEIRDDGRAFDPTHLPDPDLDVPLEERQIGGLGIHLVRNYVDSMEYRREANQNIITLKKKLPNL